ncbi:MAG: aldehyde dehydrogenase family protein, partial [Devosia sp.]|nr:aldehyde dehydrogenase family protein [Devosia sp.]
MTDGYEKLELYIDGEWTRGTGASEEVINPANEEIIGVLPHASTADLDRALAAAERGLAVWRQSTPDERSALLRRVAGLVRAEAS